VKQITYKELKKLLYFIPQQLDVSKQITILRNILYKHSISGQHSLSSSEKEYFDLYESIKSNGIKTPIKFTEFDKNSIILVDGKHRCAVCFELKLNNISIDFISPEEAIFSKDIPSNIIKDIHKEIFDENSNY